MMTKSKIHKNSILIVFAIDSHSGQPRVKLEGAFILNEFLERL